MFNATPFLRLFAKYRSAQLARMHPAKVQEEELLRLVRKAKDTHFGQEHDFANIRSVQDFQSRVPVRSYEETWNLYWKSAYPNLVNVTWPGKIPYFCLSSGTSSGATKYIPCTHEMLASNSKAGLDLLVHHLNNRPQSKIFSGKSFMLGGSADLQNPAPGVWAGDLSGISVIELPFWAKPWYFPPRDLALIKNWEEKIARFAEVSVKERITLLGGVPAWMLIFADRLTSLLGSFKGEDDFRLAHAFPHLEVLVHGGVNFQPYYRQFCELLEGSHAELREVYPASEGFFAIADRGYQDGLRLNIDHGIFYEFIPFEELGSPGAKRHWIGNVEPDVNYALVVSNCAGMWSYLIGDTVRFVDTKVPRVLMTGRTSYTLSAFGEHLIGEEVEKAVFAASEETSLQITDYAMGAQFPKSKSELGRHVLVIEGANGIPQATSLELLDRFVSTFDKTLCRINEDYEAHRSEGFGLHAPEIWLVQEGSFRDWMQSRGKLGGQNKVPRLIPQTELFEHLLAFMAPKRIL